MAGAGVRIKAFLYDYLLIVAYLIVLSGIGGFLTLGPWSSAWSDLLSTPARTDLLAFLVSVLPVVLYFTAAESSAAGATSRVLDGHRIMFGEPPGTPHAT